MTWASGKKEFPDKVRTPPCGKDSTTTPTDWCFKKLLQLKDLAPINLPLVAKVANAVVSLPVPNAWPERGASALKLLRTRLSSRMGKQDTRVPHWTPRDP